RARRHGVPEAGEPVPRVRGAAGSGVPHAGARRRHRRRLLLRRRRLRLGPTAPTRGQRRHRSRGRFRPRRLPPPWFLFLLQLIMMLWCYFMVVFTNPGAVPENWRHAAEGDGMYANNSSTISNNVATDCVNPPSTSEEQGHAPRYCSRCQNGKPPRCHHCSICDRCVLKMDHHCVWVVNCVGARNYKYFLLFLVYTFLETVLDTLVLLPSFIIFFHDGSRRPSSAGDIAILFLAFVLNLAFALSLLCFICMHTSLAASNTTSIEVYERKKTCSWEYDLGWRKNLEQVLYLAPTSCSGFFLCTVPRICKTFLQFKALNSLLVLMQCCNCDLVGSIFLLYHAAISLVD
uniref:S-acyltransferase n=1 Tax=Aegilops tauschii subsp. strangulata TaxID=200361 RepID=A0A453B850_AEGTS